MNDHHFVYIHNTVSRSERLAQLAEECAELAQAALKLRRAIDGIKNPTSVTNMEAEIQFREEIADVLLMLRYTTGGDVQFKASSDIIKTAEQKEERWVRRLKERYR